MENLIIFESIFGWQVALIALLGIVLLGILKYANAFAKVEKEKRKPIYFAITVGFSLLATIVYLLIIGQFTFEYVVEVATATYVLNQAFYTVYENTSLRDLLIKLLDLLKAKLKEKKTK